jgi:hypothetical protein
MTPSAASPKFVPAIEKKVKTGEGQRLCGPLDRPRDDIAILLS